VKFIEKRKVIRHIEGVEKLLKQTPGNEKLLEEKKEWQQKL